MTVVVMLAAWPCLHANIEVGAFGGMADASSAECDSLGERVGDGGWCAGESFETRLPEQVCNIQRRCVLIMTPPFSAHFLILTPQAI